LLGGRGPLPLLAEKYQNLQDMENSPHGEEKRKTSYWSTSFKLLNGRKEPEWGKKAREREFRKAFGG